MKRMILPLVILATIATQGAQVKKAIQYNNALNYLISNYSQDVQPNQLSTLETAERICEVNQDVSDEEMDRACQIVERI